MIADTRTLVEVCYCPFATGGLEEKANDLNPLTKSANTLCETQPARNHKITHRATLSFVFLKV